MQKGIHGTYSDIFTLLLSWMGNDSFCNAHLPKVRIHVQLINTQPI